MHLYNGGAHHRGKIVEMDLAIAVRGDLLKQLTDAPPSARRQGPLQVRGRDLAIAIAIEYIKCGSKHWLGQVAMDVQGRGQEFRIFDGTRTAAAEVGHDGPHLLGVHVHARGPQTRLQLAEADRAIVVRVELLELGPQFIQAGLPEGPGGDLQSRFPQLVVGPEPAQALDDREVEPDLRRVWRHVLDPVLAERRVRRQTAAWVHMQHVPDEDLCVVADVGPALPLEIQAPPPDELERVILRATFERRATDQQNVQDDTNAPDVALLVVPTFDDLRGHVAQRADLRAQHVLRPARARRAEIDQLQGVAFEGSIVHKQEVLRL
mmetsp:Transcript_54565/g.165875  ORF Transcript_54565/g.165875 Transcript_54565/m.165875 type:complete len:321 (-) Transcript_54565:406-1368(-)